MAFTPTTWNPLDKGASCTLSAGNLAADTNNTGSVRSVFGASSGKWYWEITNGATGQTHSMTGVGLSTALVTSGTNAYPGVDANGYGLYAADGSKYSNGTAVGTNEANWDSTGDVVGVALNMDAGTLTFYVNGVTTGVAFTGLSGTFFAMFGGGAGSYSSATANFGATAFSYTPPPGFYAGFGVVTPDYTLSGTVRDATNTPAARKVVAYREDTNALVGTTTSDATTGVYSIESPVDTAHTLVFYPAPGESLNALVLRGVLPIES